MHAWTRTETDADGAFTVQPLGSGPFRAAIGAEGHGRIWREDVQPGTDGLDMVLE